MRDKPATEPVDDAAGNAANAAEGAADGAAGLAVYAESFDELYRREYAGLVRLAVVLTGRLDVAEELVQDAFEAAHRRWVRLGSFDRPGAWVRRVVLNRCIGRHRRLLVEARALARVAHRRERAVDIDVGDGELLSAIRSLPTRQAQVVALVLLDDRSIEEVAAVLGCSEVTVRTHLRRARLALANRLGLDDPERSNPERSNTEE